jgi:hypothetical protein
MFTRILTAAGLLLAIAQAPAAASEFTPDGIEKATEACQALNTYGPVEVIKTTDDGLGDFLIWVKDKDGDLWMCNANGAGAVFTNVMMQGDLLKGDGAQLVGLQTIANTTGGAAPADVAAAVCAAVANYIEPVEVVVTVEDGLGDYVTWLKNADEQLWLCNSSGDAKIYDFEAIDLPLNDVPIVEQRFA